MNLPAFTAEFSLYRSRNSYRVATAPDVAMPAQSVVSALTYEDNVNCSRCENKCNEQWADCVGVATATWLAGLVGCAAAGPLYPLCAGPVTVAYASANGLCVGKLGLCRAICNAPGESCCPVFCGLGHCCSKGETCIPDGCCPSDRQVCGGECCPNGYSCCGDTCCPPNYFCRDGGFCSEFPSDLLPPSGTPGPPPPFNNCIFGGEPCQGKCCPPGTVCCGGSPGQPDCKTSCLR